MFNENIFKEKSFYSVFPLQKNNTAEINF